jgi:multiple sugar transport system ATP-binding protein
LVNIQKRLRTTTIFVTHDQVEAMTMGDRIAVMREGRLQQIGTPEQVYSSPDNYFVAGFIGSPSMNFLRGTLHSRESELQFISDKVRIPLPPRLQRQLMAESTSGAILGVRPQHVSISMTPSENHITGQIFALEHLGREIVVSIEYGGTDRFKVIAGTSFPGRIADTVYLDIDTDSLFIFDADSGVRLAPKQGVTEGGSIFMVEVPEAATWPEGGSKGKG